MPNLLHHLRKSCRCSVTSSMPQSTSSTSKRPRTTTRSSSRPCPRLPQVHMRAGRRITCCGSLADRRRRTPRRVREFAPRFPGGRHAVVRTGCTARASSDSLRRVPMLCPLAPLPRQQGLTWIREATTAGHSSGRRSRAWMRNLYICALDS